MKIAMLTTWDVMCGIAQNSKFLVNELCKDNDVRVFSQKNDYTDLDAINPTEFNGKEIKCWSWYGRSDKVEFDVEPVKEFKPDVIHIQYESFLWHESYLSKLKGIAPMVITHHSSCTGPGCPVSEVSANIVHDEEFPDLPNRRVIPMGIPDTFDFVDFEDTEPVMGSFGLHRNDDEYCKRAMLVASMRLSDPIHYRTHYGNSKWIPMKNLIKELQKNRMLALIYPKTEAAVSSSAACVALSTGLPVLCSNTKWFNHLKKYVHLIDTEEEMAHIVSHYMTEKDLWEDSRERARIAIEDRGWTKIGKIHECLYREMINE